MERQRAFWQRTMGLTPFDVRNLLALYFATFIMRAAAFAGVAVMQHVVFPDRADALWKGLLFAVYPIAEIACVGYFGTLCDRSGRKRILVFAHLITAAAVFLFIVGIGLPTDLEPYLIGVFFAMFGIGAGAKVASTLAMVNDHSSLENRAQLMAVFDLVTFGGLVGGFGFGFLALNAWHWAPALVLLSGGIGVTLSVVMVQFLVSDARFTPAPPIGSWGLLKVVFRNRDILRLLPVYIPVVALYGYVLTFTDQLIAGRGGANVPVSELIAVVLAFGVPLALSLGISGRWSDKSRLRKPFMLLGLTCFGGLAILFSLATQPGGGMDLVKLFGWTPLIVLFAAGAGTFPPAALAYLGDIIERSVSGTSFGIYSIIFGSGLIVGPIVGGGLTEALGPLAFAIISLSLIAISGTAVLFLRESARSPSASSLPAAAADPPQIRP